MSLIRASGGYPYPQIAVACNDRELLDWLRTRFSGTITRKKRKRSNEADSYDWRLYRRRALEFMELIRPYVQLDRKCRRIDLLLADYRNCTPRNGKYSEEQRTRKAELTRRFYALKY